MHTEAFRQTSFYTEAFHTQTLLYRVAFTNLSFVTPGRACTAQLLHRGLLHTDAFTQSSFAHRSFYAQKLLQTAAFTHSPLYTGKPLYIQSSSYTQKHLHREAFTHRRFTHGRFYTGTFLHRAAFTHKSIYTEKLLHRGAFIQSSFYTEVFTQRSLYTGQLFHISTQTLCTQGSFYTQKLLHREGLTQSSFYTQKYLQREAFTPGSFTHRITHRHFTPDAYRQRQLLHTAGFTHRRFDTPFRQTPFKAVQTGSDWLRHGLRLAETQVRFVQTRLPKIGFANEPRRKEISRQDSERPLCECDSPQTPRSLHGRPFWRHVAPILGHTGYVI